MGLEIKKQWQVSAKQWGHRERVLKKLLRILVNS